MILSTLIWGCTEKTTSQYDGSWKLIECECSFDDSNTLTYPGNITTMDGAWMIADNYGIFLLKYTIEGDSTVYADYGKTSLKFENNTVTEKYLISNDENLIGKTLLYEVEQKGDTLILKGPSENGKDEVGFYLYEVFVRD